MKHEHDRGLAHDLVTLLRGARRRDFLRLLAGASVAPLLGCGGDGGRNGSPSGGEACAEIPPETAGPFPGDGSNGADALALSGIVRSDIRSSIAGATGTADGVVLTVVLTLVDTGGDCAPLAGRPVYIWQCDREGRYSMYSEGATEENYLRGVQVSDGAGSVTFTTIFPACYPGRWPHIHFAVYPDVDTIRAGGEIATSQLALPVGACEAVYATSGYGASIETLAEISLESDGVFRDGATLQLAGATGDAAGGFTATLEVGIGA